ncbi:uncharacterized protein LOC143301763 [Babylonia areolata]|uniref:uncharacterized protein LOC143301763 n=1 Tax=Babylonia areolata TaxID=304850 RepID=UPI003FD68B86
MNSSTILLSISARDNGGQPTSPSVSSDANITAASDQPESGGPQYSVELMVLFLMLVVFFVLGVVGNALAFYIYYQKRDKTTSTLFILSLAATDFLTCLIVIPYTLAAELLRFRLVYDLLCKGYMFCMTFNVPLSAFIMVAVGFDRYFCICHPFLHAMTVRRAKVLLVCLTLLACGLGIITALGFGVYYTTSGEEVEVSGVVLPEVNASSLSSSSSSSAGLSLEGSSSSTSFTPSPSGSVYDDVFNSSLGAAVGSSSFSSSSSSSSSLESTSVVNSVDGGRGGGYISDMEGEEVEGGGGSGNGTRRGGGGNNVTTTTTTIRVIYYGQCVPNTLIVSEHFVEIYQKVYAATFLFSFLTIALLYALIYRSILIRRAWKAKRKRMSCYNSTITTGPETVAEETQLTNINNGNTAAAVAAAGADAGSTAAAAAAAAASGRVTTRTSVALRDRMLYANIKTAAMLFVVTVVFVISFLPSWLIGLGVMRMYYILFYIFFFNNVANPFIYAFMNRTFRDDLRQLLKRIKNRLSGW